VAFLFLGVVAGCNDQGTEVDMPTPGAELDGMLYVVGGQAGQASNDGDGGHIRDAYFYWPIDVTPIEATGELIVVDWYNHRFRWVGADGIISAFIGSGFLGDGRAGPALAMDFNHPTQILKGPDGHWWIAAFHNWCIKHVDANTMTAIQAIGDTARGYRGDWPENNGSIDAGARPRFDLPSSMIFDTDGILYFMDQGNTRIRKIDLATRTIYQWAGGTRGYQDGIGTDAQFAFPGAQTVGTGDRGGTLALTPDKQNIYIADTENHRIRMINIATAMVTTIAGVGTPGWTGDGGPALSAELNFPTDIECAQNGDLYVADMHNHVVRKIDAATGIITTVAGSGSIGVSPDGTPAREAKFYQPVGVAYNNVTKTLYICDQYNHQIRKVINP
jgi:sugar lactone lactonase YvrE